jgi:hypothetical protein
MFKRNLQNDEHLDRAGKVILRAAAADEQEIERAAESPFLFTRVRARITAQLRESESGGWQSLPLIAWRAIPAMALIAMLAGGLMIWTRQSASKSNIANAPPVWYRLDDEALTDTTDPGVEQTVLSRNNLSHEDVFDMVIERGTVENKK